MRKSWIVVILAVALLVGYALLRGGPAVAQGEFQPFAVGETVQLTVESFPGVNTITCKVVSVNNYSSTVAVTRSAGRERAISATCSRSCLLSGSSNSTLPVIVRHSRERHAPRIACR